MCELAAQGDGTVKIETVRLGVGCPVNCVSCGAYPNREEVADLFPMQVSEERIKEMLERKIKPRVSGLAPGSADKSSDGEPLAEGELTAVIQQSTRLKIVNLFADYVTTDINEEPLKGDAFLHFARLVRELSGGKKRVVCISHGLLVKPIGVKGKVEEKERKRLKEIVDFMDEDDVFVLSMDYARLGGRISDEVNFASYVETLRILRNAVEKGARVTISIQGVDEESGDVESRETEIAGEKEGRMEERKRLSRVRADKLCTRVLTELRDECRWRNSEIDNIKIDRGRQWVSLGRARRRPGVDPNGRCPVIPDARFVRDLDATHTRAGLLDMVDGKVYFRSRDHESGYGDTAAWNLWRSGDKRKLWGWEEAFVSPDPVKDLTAQFSRAARLAMLSERKAAAKGVAAATAGEDKEERGGGSVVEEAVEDREKGGEPVVEEAVEDRKKGGEPA